MALVWGAVCCECQVLAVQNCPHCMRDFCEKHNSQHGQVCEKLHSRDFAVAG